MKLQNQIKLEPRAYHDESDLAKMGALLRAGNAAANGTFYALVGDLYWGLYYPPFEGELWADLYLWDDPADPQRLLAWALTDPKWGTFDVYVQPELRPTQLADAIYTWTEEHLAAILRAAGKDAIKANYIADQDDIVIARLLAHGFQRTQSDAVCFTQSLDGQLSPPALPDGWVVRGSKGVTEVTARATAQYNAFTNTAPFEQYVERFRRFMQSPVYDPECDVVAAAPDGRIGAFCIVWPDPVSKIGLFEPVGAHPDFQRRGLGKAVMTEALQRLKVRGMTHARVSTLANNLPGVKLYESVGFRIAHRLGTYEKKLV